MQPHQLLILFISLKIVQHLVETWLAFLNRQYYENDGRRAKAAEVLQIPASDMEKTLHYSRDKYRFGRFSNWFDIILLLGFIGLGGFGLIESWAKQSAAVFGMELNTIVIGLAFFGILGAASLIVSIPFDIYFNFVLEEKHGFNRQTVKTFVVDHVKNVAIGVVLGSAVLATIFWIMGMQGPWWLYAWLVLFGVNLLVAWVYPVLLAPLFNKFSPIEDGELKEKIFTLAKKINFKAGSISIMDASKRSSHGNAYFTGIFGEKKIVLFDNLVKSMSADEVVAVLAHELGHFKLNHVRWRLVRSFLISGLIFWLLGYSWTWEQFYHAFSLETISPYGALLVFSIWFGLVSFLLQPIGSYFSRRNEFAADAFALDQLEDKSLLGKALLKLRETSNVMPITHPVFSTVYLSHPPLLERLRAMKYIK